MKRLISFLLLFFIMMQTIMVSAGESKNLSTFENGAYIKESSGFLTATPPTRILDGDISTIARTSNVPGYVVVDLGKYSKIDSVCLYTPYSATLINMSYYFYYSDMDTNYEQNTIGLLTAQKQTIDNKDYCVYSEEVGQYGRYIKIKSSAAQLSQMSLLCVYGEHVEKKTLETPAAPVWNEKILTWEENINAETYTVELYKDGELDCTLEQVSTPLDLSEKLAYNGQYEATVKAIADNFFYKSSAPSEKSLPKMVYDGAYNIAMTATGTGITAFYTGYEVAKSIDGLYGTYSHVGYNIPSQTDNPVNAIFEYIYTATVNLKRLKLYLPDGLPDDYYTLEYSSDHQNWFPIKGNRKSSSVLVAGLNLKLIVIDDLDFEAKYVRAVANVKENSRIFEFEMYGKFKDYPTLATPENVILTNDILSWNAVDNAEKYRINIYTDGVLTDSMITTETSISLAERLNFMGTYTAEACALAEGYTDSGFARAEGKIEIPEGIINGKTIKVSSNQQNSPSVDYQLEYIVDNDLSTAYTIGTSSPYEITAELLNAVYIKKITVNEPKDLYHIANCTIAVSENGLSWKEIYRGTIGDNADINVNRKAKYIRISIHSVSGTPSGIAEITIHAAGDGVSENETLKDIVIPEKLENGYVLPKETADGMRIIWSASDEGVLSISGEKTVILAGSRDIAVVLTALTEDGASVKFQTIVAGKNTSQSGGGGSSKGAAAVVIPDVSATSTPQETQQTDKHKEMKNELRGHWAEAEISEMIDEGIVMGDENGLALERKVTRAEFITLLVRCSEKSVEDFGGCFSDVEVDSWFAPYVETAYANGWVNGSEGMFYPQKILSREEMAQILYNIYGTKNGTSQGAGLSFADEANISPWAKNAVSGISAAGILIGDTDGNFLPKKPVTRESAMVAIYRLIRERKV